MNKLLVILLGLTILIGSSTAQPNQTPGLIIETGNAVLDPNGDGYVSIFSTGFSDPLNDVDEFEIPMFGIPIFGDGESVGDVSVGQDCGVTDLALDTAGYALYATLDDNRNLIFRFRLAGNKPSVESYSVLIDTDNAVGSADSNSNSNNPGFEYAVTLIQRQGVNVYEIDGESSCPTAILTYDWSTHQQKSIAASRNCDDEDFFLDFYIPFDEFTDLTGISSSSPLRFSGVTNVSATCPLGGTISDIGGVDDNEYDGCFECAIIDLTENQCSVPLDSLCADCNGFPEGPTTPPVIQKPVQAGDVVVKGTADPFATIFIDIFDENEAQYVQDTVVANEDSLWVSNEFSPALNLGDSIVVFAAAPGKCNSGLSVVGTNYALVTPNESPVVSGESDTYEYLENSGFLKVDTSIQILDDDITIASANVTISNNFRSDQDVLALEDSQGLTVNFDATTGTFAIIGESTIDVYRQLLRSVTFRNDSESPNTDLREISITVSDGSRVSNIYRKNILIREVNDAPYFYADQIDVQVDTFKLATQEDVSIDTCLNVFDVEGEVFFITATKNQGIVGEITLNDPASGCIEYLPGANLSGQDFFSLNVCDQLDSSICSTSIVKVDIVPVNDPPVITQFDEEVDTLRFSTIINTDIQVCIEGRDAEGNSFDISSVDSDFSHGSVSSSSDLCFIYSPTVGESEVTEYLLVEICDDAADSKCNTVVVSIRIEGENEPPDIIDENGISIDTLYFTIEADSLLNYCIAAVDPNENDNVSIDTVIVDNPEEVVGKFDILGQLCLEFEPDPTFRGTKTFKTVVCDNGTPKKCDSLYLIVDIINSRPEIIDDKAINDTVYYKIDEKSALSDCLQLVDGSGNQILLSGTEIVNGNGQFSGQIDNDRLCFSFVPEVNSPASQTIIQIQICDDDPQPLCSTFTIVIDVNIAPRILNDDPDFADSLFYEIYAGQSLAVCEPVEDANGDDLNVISTRLKDGAGSITTKIDDLSSQFCIEYTAPETATTAIYDVTICDNGDPQACTTVEVVINVLPGNNEPVLIGDSGEPTDTVSFTVNEDEVLSSCLDIQDPEEDNVTLSVVDPDAVPAFNLDDPANYCFSFDPSGINEDQLFVAVNACDNGVPETKCAEIVVEIRINRKPELLQDGLSVDTVRYFISEDEVLEECLTATDRNGDELQFSVEKLDGDIDLTLDANSSICFRFDPTTSQSVFDRFVLTSCDIQDLCDEVVVEITTNRSPVIYGGQSLIDTIRVDLFKNQSLDSCFTVRDVNGDALALENINFENSGSTLSGSIQSESLCISYEPPTDFAGIDYVRFDICDNGQPLLCSTVVLEATIFDNSPPIIEIDGVTTDSLYFEIAENSTLSECLNIVDAENNNVSVSNSQLISGSAFLNARISDEQLCLEYIPDKYFFGESYYILTLQDDGQPVSTTRVAIVVKVLPTNELPEAVNDTVVIKSLEVNRLNLLQNDSDPESEGLFVSELLGVPSSLEASISNDSILTLRSLTENLQNTAFDYLVCDRGVPQACVQATVVVLTDFPGQRGDISPYQAFSPNGDQINDVWVVEGLEDYPGNSVRIFDQWNNLIFSTNDYDNSNKVWRGQKNGTLMSGDAGDGTYYYVIDPGNGSDLISGFVVLKR